MTNKTTDGTVKYFLASWEDEHGYFITPPILFREEECAKVESLLIYAGMANVLTAEAER